MKKQLFGMLHKTKKKTSHLLKKATQSVNQKDKPKRGKELGKGGEEEEDSQQQHNNRGRDRDASTSDAIPSERTRTEGAAASTSCSSDEEWVDCAEESGEGEAKVDVRLEQLLTGVGPLVREQFLNSIASNEYTRKHKLMAIVGTFNVNGKTPEEDTQVERWLLSETKVDMYVAGFQEIVPLTASNVLADNFAMQPALLQWETKLDRTLNGVSAEESEKMFLNGSMDYASFGTKRQYVPLVAKSMVGIYLTVWVKTSLLPAITYKEVVSVSCGVMRVLGNKGSVGVRLRVYDTYLSFICVHLSSGESESDCGRRYWDLSHIFQKSTLGDHHSHGVNSSFGTMEMYNILDSDYCFLFGDLNFRLNAEDEYIRGMIRNGNYMSLLEVDQLNQGRDRGELLQGWQEGEITFPPTFKYTIGTDTYVGSEKIDKISTADNNTTTATANVEKKAQKKRTPAWCDRILWKAIKSVKLFGYSDVAEIRLSDHKPVFCGFMIHLHEYLEKELEDAVQRARRLADLKEMEGRPCLELPDQFFDFGLITYDKKVTRVVTIENAGPVDAHWHLSTTGDKPDWLEVYPVQGKVPVGNTSEIKLVIHVEGGIAGSAGQLSKEIDTILVMTVAGAGDKFISITGKYQLSCFGVSPDRLSEQNPATPERVEKIKSEYAGSRACGAGAVDDGGDDDDDDDDDDDNCSQDLNTPHNQSVGLQLQLVGERVKCLLNVSNTAERWFDFVPIVPLELQNLIYFIVNNGGLKKPNLIISPTYPSLETIDLTRGAMDSDTAIPSCVTPVDASLVLLMYLTSFPQPLLPKQVADVCSLCVPEGLASLDLLRNNMNKTSYATFLYLMKFFREVLKKENAQHNGLTVDILSGTLASVFLTYEIQAGGPMSAEGTLGYNDIIKRRADFLKSFLVQN